MLVGLVKTIIGAVEPSGQGQICFAMVVEQMLLRTYNADPSIGL
jgi:hypothetical protein